MSFNEKTNVTTRKVDPSEVSFRFTKDLQMIARNSWAVEVPTRSDTEIAYVFRADDSSFLRDKRERYKRYAAQGGLVIATSITRGDDPIGYAVARNTLEGNKFEKLKQVFTHSYKGPVSLDAVAVEPRYRLTPDTQLDVIDEVLGGFSDELSVTHPILGEDIITPLFMSTIGFARRVTDTPPPFDTSLFGPARKPVQTYTYEAQSVQAVHSAIAALRQIL